MKSLADIAAENKKRRASLLRLKRLIRGRAISWDSGAYLAIGRVINAAIDAWAAKERGR